MTIEDLLRDTLTERLDSVDVPPGDVHRALDAGASRSRRMTWVVAAASLAALTAGAAVAQLVGGTSDGEPSTSAPDVAGWTRLPEPPLSPRAHSLMVWTGEEVLVLGGETDGLCPPNADCAYPPATARDGAAYDPATETWRTIADAPFSPAPWTPHVMAGQLLVVMDGSGAFFGYDPSTDQWRDLPARPEHVRLRLNDGRSLSAFDGLVYAQAVDGTVATLDPHTRTWSLLPSSPHQPRIEGSLVIPTPEGIVVIGQDSSGVSDGTVPNYLLAEVYRDGEWTRLERSDIVGGYSGWHWTGERLIAPYGECVDGGEVNGYGRCIPTGGALDPATGTWQPTGQAPTLGNDRLWSLSGAAGSLVATYGHVYDDTDGSWRPIDRPAGAPDHGVSAVFGGGSLFAFGGVDWAKGFDDNLSKEFWVSTP